ncbi:MMPL family transporter, partial [Georgenia subflava]
MFDLIGRFVARHPRVVVLVWALLAVVCGTAALTGFAGPGLFERLQTGAPVVPGSESEEGREILTAEGESPEQVSMVVQGVDLADPAALPELAAALEPAHTDLAALDGVESVVDPFVLPDMLANPAAAGLVSAEQDGFLMVVVLADDAEEGVHDAVVERLREVPAELAGTAPGASGIVSSNTLFADAIVEQVQEDLVAGEAVALPVALLIMVVVFGGFLAAGLPLIGAVVSIVGGLGILLALTYSMNVDSFVVNVVTVLSLALSIDYGLLVVSRYREEIHRLERDRPAEAAPAGRRRRRRAGRDP